VTVDLSGAIQDVRQLKGQNWHFPNSPWFDSLALDDSVWICRWTLHAKNQDNGLMMNTLNQCLIILAWLILSFSHSTSMWQTNRNCDRWKCYGRIS